MLRLLSSHALRATDGALLERIQRMTARGEPCPWIRSIAACPALLLGLAGLGVGAVPTHAPATLIVELESTDSADFDLAIDAEHALFVGDAGLSRPPGAWMKRVIVVAHSDLPQRVQAARATRLRIDAAAPAIGVRGANFVPRPAKEERVELRLIDVAR